MCHLKSSLWLPMFYGAFALWLTGCQSPDLNKQPVTIAPSQNPITVNNVTRNDKLVKISAAQHPHILATYSGEYHDVKLERMVAKIVGKLTLATENPHQTYRITILNSSNINAFALPGGFVYVTRGLLALANDSSEVAAVIAHEMAHVTANHGIQRQQKEAETVIAGRVVSEVLHNDNASSETLIRSKLRLAQFSRNQELQADEVGIKTMSAAGYDPFAAARFLHSMEAYRNFRFLSGVADASLDFLATHPATPQRIELAINHARQVSAPGIGTTDRDRFLNGIDGIIYGDSPKAGYVRGHHFIHPRLGIMFTVPKDFRIDNTATAVMVSGPDKITIRFDGAPLAKGSDLTRYMKSGWISGLDKTTIHATSINGLPAATAHASADQWQFDIVVIGVDNRVYRFLTITPMGSPAFLPISQSIVQSFKILSPAEKASLKPLRIRVITAKPTESTEILASQIQDTERKLDLFRLLNGIRSGDNISAGERVKIISE